MISRARSKVIVFISEELAYHLSQDIDVLNNSRLLSKFVNSYLTTEKELILEYNNQNKYKQKGVLKYI